MLTLLLPILLPVILGIMLFIFKCFDKRNIRNAFVGAALIISAAVTLIVVFNTEGTLTLWKITESAPSL